MSALAEQSLDGLSTGQLVSRIAEQLSTLVHDEIALAENEMKRKARKAGLGFGIVGGAGVIAVFAGAASSPRRSSASPQLSMPGSPRSSSGRSSWRLPESPR